MSLRRDCQGLPDDSEKDDKKGIEAIALDPVEPDAFAQTRVQSSILPDAVDPVLGLRQQYLLHAEGWPQVQEHV